MKPVAFLLILAACGKADEPRPEATPTTVDPACETAVKELEPFVAQLAAEEATHEVDFVYALAVVDLPAAKVEQEIDNVYVTAKAIEAFDETEVNRADTKLGETPAQSAVVERLAAIEAMGSGERLRVDVDGAARWADVARTIEAATAAGYKEAIFAFTAASKMTAPAGVEDRTTAIEVFDAAGARMEELGKTCPGLGKYTSDAAAITTALLGCNCAAAPDEVRALRWKLARWGQARPRVGVVVALGGPGAQPIEQRGDAPWSEAHVALVEARTKGAVTLVAK
jgi:hypothetical protein